MQSIRESLFGRGEIVRAALGSSLLPGSGPGETRRRASPCAKVQFFKNMAGYGFGSENGAPMDPLNLLQYLVILKF